MVTDSGLQIRNINGVNVLSYNGKRIDAVMDNVGNSYGLYINGQMLNVDGVDIAKSAKDAAMLPTDDGVMLNEVDLLTEGVCINITKANYNLLVGGYMVAGYKHYNPSDVYNIVADVSSAAKITYSVVGNKLVFSGGIESLMTKNVVYNSVGGMLTENTVNLANTVSDTTPPLVSVKPFRAVVEPNSRLALEYYVDSDNMPLNDGYGLGRTFTVIIETASGSVVKKTTYAGEFVIETPVFTTEGETWFSITVIDSNGVGSAVKYYDVFVKAAVADNFYQMQDTDLETYGIVVDNDDVSIAEANKAALSTFFAAVANGSHDGTQYNGVIMINEVYWLDYHGDDVEFPNGFTVDLNGATIRATLCNDLNIKELIRLGNNIDTHIINGNLVGNYEGFDFETTRVNTGKDTLSSAGEHLSVTSMRDGSRYCSFRNLDISQSVGYECVLDGGFGNGSEFHPETSMTDNTAVDLATGEVVSKDDMVTTKLLELRGAKEIAFGKGGYGGFCYLGKRHEIFYSFYNANGTYLGSVKSKLYYLCKVPATATTVRVTGYGGISTWDFSSGGEFDFWRDPTTVKNVEVINCHWHDTRTIAISPFKVKGARIINCTYHNISKEIAGGGTLSLGDFEDGRNWTDAVLLDGCSCSGNYSHKIILYCCRGFHFRNNSGIAFKNEGVEDGFIEDNDIPELEIWLRPIFPRTFVIYRRNAIGTISRIGWSPTSPGYFDINTVKDTVVMSDTVINSYCPSERLALRNSKNGNVKVI